MQQRLKSVFRRSSKSKGSAGQHERFEGNTQSAIASLPHDDRHRESSSRHGRTSVDSSGSGSVYTGRSRPVSSIYDKPQTRAPTGPKNDDLSPSTDPAIARDYKAYLPALSPVNDEHGEDYLALGEDRHHVAEGSDARHEEDVADRNIAKYSTSPNSGHRRTTASHDRRHSHRVSIDTDSVGSAMSSVQTGGSVGRYSTGQEIARNGHLDRDVSMHAETRVQKPDLQKRLSSRSDHLQNDMEMDTGKPQLANTDHSSSQLSQETYEVRSPQSYSVHATIDRTAYGEETMLAKKLREDGVVDLRNTVDTDGDITWAPAVTHEVIKPHQHEIVQHKIYREIHNYEYFHRIQPVRMTEVLPPRHWIPNPDGEGLIEISADELPARTGENRWWSICEHSNPDYHQTTVPKYRTEPEIIEAGTFITEEGFERKETIILHPPTLADLTGYGGPVQAMHFDHKTGKSWMGELTTMDKLQQLQKELDRASDVKAFEMDSLAKSLPNVPSTSGHRDSNSIPRKPINGQASAVHSSNIGRKMAAA
ncbi:hypothetical protein OPT61_g7745 [Boeremia exigua]|uniref:Uncharacterized protein n=1 Tax=Boeremia exigua TaxID=749465 RepID=A0ACC2I108_9PLEO|nr:hypothetical protein OPT61_g7745 [Boeremia exigua]